MVDFAIRSPMAVRNLYANRADSGVTRRLVRSLENPVLCRNWIDENDPEIAGLARFGRLDGAEPGAESGTRS